MNPGVASIALTEAIDSDGQPSGRLRAMSQHPGTRAVVLDATAPSPELSVPVRSPAFVLFPTPLVVAFESHLAGPATELALACDIRVCSDKAALAGPLRSDARVRTLASEHASVMLSRGRAALPAETLLAEGLVWAVTAPGEALDEALRVAELIASRGPIATRLAKEAVWRGLALPLDQALRFETDLTLLLQTTKDRAEGVRAFLEKRRPNFTGE